MQIDAAFAQMAEAIRAQGSVPEEVVIGLEMLRGSVGRWLSGQTGALCAPKHGRWVVSPTGLHLDLIRRPTLRRVMAALVEARVQRPGETITSAELIAAGWPDEHAGPEASANRLRVAICRLRQFGLENVILTTGTGWMLNPSVPVAQSDEPEVGLDESGERATVAPPARPSGIYVNEQPSSDAELVTERPAEKVA